MSEGEGLSEENINHFQKTLVKNIELEIFQFLKTAFVIYFYVLMCYNLLKCIFER